MSSLPDVVTLDLPGFDDSEVIDRYGEPLITLKCKGIAFAR